MHNKANAIQHDAPGTGRAVALPLHHSLPPEGKRALPPWHLSTLDCGVGVAGEEQFTPLSLTVAAQRKSKRKISGYTSPGQMKRNTPKS